MNVACWAKTATRRCEGVGSTAWFLLPFSSLYAAYGATFGLLGGGAPLVLRARGMSLSDIGLLQLIYLPIGAAFLWAPLVDRFKLPRLPHRVGWIAAGIGAATVLLLILSQATRWPIAAIFTLAVAVSTALATADVALEALVVETVAPTRRPIVTTAKLCGSSIGTMAGVALATAFPDRMDLATALVLVAVLDAILLLPILAYPEVARRLAVPSMTRRRPTRERMRFLASRAAILGFFFAPAIMLVSVPSLVLLDLKLPLPTVGFFTGTTTTAINIVMTLLSGFLLMRVAAHRLTSVLACGVVLSGVLFVVATARSSAWLGFVAAIINVLFEGGLGVPVFNVIYQWAEGEHAATDYAVLFGIAFLVSFPVRVLSPMLASAIGWPAYFAACVPVYAVAVAALAVAMKNTPTQSLPASAR